MISKKITSSPDYIAHICFVAPTAFSVMSGDNNIETVGGAEVQQVILAKALVKTGYKVTMICMDHGQDNQLVIDGVCMLKAYKPHAGLPVIRFLYPRLSTIWQCMKNADADIYYQRTSGMLTGVVAAFCKFTGKKSIFSGASNPDFIKDTPKITYQRDRWLYEYGLRNVDQIIVQNPYQLQLCKENYHRDSILINSCYPYPANATNNPSGYILWVGTIRQVKRPDLFIKLAELLPNYSFVMVGGEDSSDKNFYNTIKAQANALPNVQFLGFLPYAQADKYFDGARLFVNTSDIEGFPNTFLQAWARKIPTVSFFDCGARKNGQPIGLIVESITQMRDVVEKNMTNNQEWLSQGTKCLTYYKVNYSLQSAIQGYEAVFSTFLQSDL